MEEPKFLLPETAEDWRNSKLRLLGQYREDKASRDNELATLRNQLADAGKRTGAFGELGKRSAEKELRDYESRPFMDEDALLKNLEARFRSREQEYITKEGRVILERREDNIRRGRCLNGIRRLVVFHNRPFVCFISVPIEDGPEQVAYVTDSLAQMTEKELEALDAAGF